MDNEILTINHKFKENLKIIRRNFKSEDSLGIFCDSHPNN